jgi:membrane-bound lytic murein transglycosylase D
MKFARPVTIGRRLNLEFGHVNHEELEEKRCEYHVEFQENHFAEHRTIGTEVHIVRKGDALWNVTQRFDHLPLWLLLQYNPNVDLADLRPGIHIVMPRVEHAVAQ